LAPSLRQLTSRSSTKSLTLAGSERSLLGLETQATAAATKVFPEHLHDLTRRLEEIEEATRRIEDANAALADTVAGLKPFLVSKMGIKARARSAPSARLAPLAGSANSRSAHLTFKDLNGKWDAEGRERELASGSPLLLGTPQPQRVSRTPSRSPSPNPNPTPSSPSPSPLLFPSHSQTQLHQPPPQPHGGRLRPLGDPQIYSPLVRSFFSVVDAETARPVFVKPPSVLERVRSAAFLDKGGPGALLRKVAVRTAGRARQAMGPAEIAVAENLARGHEAKLDKVRALWRGAIVRKRLAVLRSGVRRAAKLWRARKFKAQLEARAGKLRVSEADAQAMRERAQEKLKTSPRLLTKVKLAVGLRRSSKWFSDPDRKARADRLAAELAEAGRFHIQERRQRAESALGARTLPPVLPATEASEVAPGSSDSVIGFVPLDFLKNLKRALQPIRSSEERIRQLRARAGLAKTKSTAKIG
jgi:hypothetical protein